LIYFLQRFFGWEQDPNFMSKLLFLDINGVLGSSKQSNMANVIANVPRDPSHHIWYFYPEYVARLETLVKATNPNIVLCSSCRKTYTLDEIRDCVYNAGGKIAADLIIDATPGDKLGNRMHRGREVAMWLALSDVYHDATYCIIDDATDYYPAQRQYHVWVDNTVGLQDHDVKQATSILTGVYDKWVLF
jgi:hypothetical protein